MRKIHRLATASLACLLLLAAAADTSAARKLPNRRARQTADRDRGATGAKSDYSAITEVNLVINGQTTVGVATICYFTANGCREQRVEGRDTMDALAKAVARLGGEGWTMVGPATTFGRPDSTALYFIRPRR